MQHRRDTTAGGGGGSVPEGSRSLNWPTIVFLTASPAVAFGGVLWWFLGGHANWLTAALALAMAGGTGLGITAGYHRLFAHRSYESPWPARLSLLLLGGACFEGSVWEWCIDHRRHHRHIDGERDPYSISRGFWHAHILWLFFRVPPKERETCAADLWSDPLVRFQHRFYLPLALSVSFLLPLGIASLWGDPVGGLFVAGALRLVLNQHFTFAINSVCHCFGKQTYSTRHSARDNWLTSLFTYGEGYHNFHHEFPSDYRNGVRFYHWDPTKWLIRTFSCLGLARNLVRVDPETIALKKLAVKEERLRARLSGGPSALAEFAQGLLESASAQVQHVADRLRQLRREYHRLTRAERARARRKYLAVKRQVRQAERELRHSLALYETMARRLQSLLAASASVAAAA